MNANEEQLITYIDSVIEQLNQIKLNPAQEIQNHYFTLTHIAWHMEQKSVSGIRPRRRGRLQTDSDSD